MKIKLPDFYLFNAKIIGPLTKPLIFQIPLTRRPLQDPDAPIQCEIQNQFTTCQTLLLRARLGMVRDAAGQIVQAVS